MKNLFTLSFILFSFILRAELVMDSVSNGAGYATQSFYSLKNGEVSNINNKDWDIAFSLSSLGAAGSAILINEINTQLWAVPQDTSFWAAFDTTGYKTWSGLYNSDTTWVNGAFNKYRGDGPNGTFDMGWGHLDPNNNFWTLGDSLYLCKLGNGEFKKLWIESLKQGKFSFRVANIDGSGDTTISITKTNYPNKNFIYVSLESNEILDREPNNNTWDLTFVGHKDELLPGKFLPVASVFGNRNTWTAKKHSNNYDEAILTTEPETDYNQRIDNIGREWKAHSGGVWYIYDSISYFIFDQDSSLYRVVFTDFTGSASGKSFFSKEKMLTTSIKNLANDITFSLYPNPSSHTLNIVLALKNPENVTFKIYDTKGQLTQEFNQNNVSNFEVIDVNVSDFKNGLYFMVISGDSFQTTKQFLKK